MTMNNTFLISHLTFFNRTLREKILTVKIACILSWYLSPLLRNNPSFLYCPRRKPEVHPSPATNKRNILIHWSCLLKGMAQPLKLLLQLIHLSKSYVTAFLILYEGICGSLLTLILNLYTKRFNVSICCSVFYYCDNFTHPIFRERPRINSSIIDLDKLRQLPDGLFGREYVRGLDINVS